MSWVAHETAVQTKRVNMVGVPQLRCLPSVMPIIRLCRPSERAALLSIAPELSERTDERTSLVVRQRRRRRGGRQPRLPFRPAAEPGGGRPAQTNRRASGPRRSTQSVGLSPLPEPPRRTHSGGRAVRPLCHAATHTLAACCFCSEGGEGEGGCGYVGVDDGESFFHRSSAVFVLSSLPCSLPSDGVTADCGDGGKWMRGGQGKYPSLLTGAHAIVRKWMTE